MKNQYTTQQLDEMNASLLERMISDDPAMVKSAQADLTDYVRTEIFEKGFHDKVQPAQDVDMNSPNRILSAEHDTIQFSYELQPSAPSGTVLQFGATPDLGTIRGRRHYAGATRMASANVRTDKAFLATYTMDIRQVYVDIMTADLDAVKDATLINAINTMLVGPGQPAIGSTSINWRQTSGPITRTSLPDTKAIMPEADGNFQVERYLINILTQFELEKFSFNEFGGSSSQDVFLKGWSSSEVNGVELITTIKKALVPRGTFFGFGPTNALGPNYYIERPTLYCKQEAYFISFFISMMVGAALAHPHALCRNDYVAA